MAVHVRCINHVHGSCSNQSTLARDEVPAEPLRTCHGHSYSHYPLVSTTTHSVTILAPSMFGRDLTAQVHADSKNGPRQVPVIVEKCIDAVECLGKLYIRFSEQLLM